MIGKKKEEGKVIEKEKDFVKEIMEKEGVEVVNGQELGIGKKLRI